MKEVFYEETAEIQDSNASKKYNFFKGISITFYVLTIAWVLLYLNFYMSDFQNILIDLIILIIPVIILLGTGILVGRFKNRFYIDYDYTFVSGTLSFAQVFKHVKRKFLFEFDTYAIEKIGKYNSKTYYKYENLIGINKLILTSNDVAIKGKDFYYIVANVNGEKKLLILECSEQFIINILKFSNKNVLEEELLRK